MSITALIGKVDKHGDSVTAIYLHQDGYVNHVLPRLVCYSTNDSINDLLAMGDCSFLEFNLSDSIFYSRDKGEKWNVCQFDTIQDFRDAVSGGYEYGYLFKEGEWEVIDC